MNPTAEYENELIQAIILATLLFFLLAGFIIIYFVIFKRKKQQHLQQIENNRKEFEKQLLQSQIEVQESTYSTLSRELHDNVGQLLGTAKMLLGVTERKITDPPETLGIATDTISKAINELRAISRSLDMEYLQQFSFTESLQAEIRRINAGGTIEAVLKDTGIILKPESQIILFRIVQEAIQNSVRHAQPKNLDVTVEHENESLVIIVKDNGTGLTDFGNAGLGIKNMKHRTALLGGTISWNSLSPGTSVTIRIPVSNNGI